jgi:hypothetical protein
MARRKEHFACCIKASTHKTSIEAKEINAESYGFYDSVVLLGTSGVDQTKKSLELVGYSADATKYRVATTRYDLTAEQTALIQKFRWKIAKFFA